MKIAALYARVSSDRQQQQGTIASQLAALEGFARDHDYQVAPQHIFQDDGYSGARLDRPALDRLREAAAAGDLETVIVLSPDRLARQFAYQYVLVEELELAGCRVIFTSQAGLEGLKALGDKPEERMLEQMKGVFAEYERAQIAERCRRGRLFRARGGQLWLSCAPYGYRYLPQTESCAGRLVINEEEATIVRLIFGWLVDQQLSTYQIVKRLNQSGVSTRGGNPRWAESTIGGILRNPVHAGIYYYNCRQKVERKPVPRAGEQAPKPRASWRTRRPKEEWIGIEVPAIIERSTWDQAQEQLRVNRERAGRNNKRHEYLLRSLLVCGCCGLRMHGVCDRNGVRRYQCSGKESLRSSPTPCPSRLVRADQIEELVWQSLSELLRDPNLLAEQYQLRTQSSGLTPAQEEQQRLSRKEQALNREEQRLIDAYQSGILELEILKERRARIAQELSRLATSQAAVCEQIEQQQQQQSLLTSLEEFTRTISASLDNPSFETKQKILRLVVDKIEFKENEVGIKYLIPISNTRLQPYHFRRAHRGEKTHSETE